MEVRFVTKDVIDAIRERRSVRRFENTEVPTATIGRILECARLTPSAGNRQPWLFLVVYQKEKRKQLAELANRQDFVAEAPVVMVVVADIPRSAERYGSRGATLYCLQDTAAAVQNILLAATGFGLGTCWVGDFDEEGVAHLFDLDYTRQRPVAIIPIGYPAENPRPRPRRPIEEIVRIYN